MSCRFWPVWLLSAEITIRKFSFAYRRIQLKLRKRPHIKPPVTADVPNCMECLPLMTAGRKTRIWDLGAGSREQWCMQSSVNFSVLLFNNVAEEVTFMLSIWWLLSVREAVIFTRPFPFFSHRVRLYKQIVCVNISANWTTEVPPYLRKKAITHSKKKYGNSFLTLIGIK